MNVAVEISIGEFFDRLTILEIKQSRIRESAKLENINRELNGLNRRLDELPFSRKDVSGEVGELKAINEELWRIEEELRSREKTKAFDDGFIELARAVYRNNDRRFQVKKAINLRLGSDLVEEKSYGS